MFLTKLMKQLLIYPLASVLLASIAFFLSEEFTKFSTSLLELNGKNIVINSLKGQFEEKVFFAIALSTIPMILFFTKKVTQYKKRSYPIAGLVLLTGTIAWGLRILLLNKHLKRHQTDLIFEHLNFSAYLLIGFVVGGMISVLLFKRKTRPVQ